MRPASRLRASEPEAQADRRIDVDRSAGLKAVGQAVPDFRPHHTGIHVEFLGETEAIIDERRKRVFRAGTALVGRVRAMNDRGDVIVILVEMIPSARDIEVWSN